VAVDTGWRWRSDLGPYNPRIAGALVHEAWGQTGLESLHWRLNDVSIPCIAFLRAIPKGFPVPLQKGDKLDPRVGFPPLSSIFRDHTSDVQAGHWRLLCPCYPGSGRTARVPHQEKKCAPGRTGCVLTHQALGTLWTHPGSAHTAPNAKRTGNVNSDAAGHGTMHLDAAVSGHFSSRRSHVRAFSFWTQPCQGKWHPDDVCHGTVVTLAVKARNIAANTRVAITNTQQVPGIVTPSSSILISNVHLYM